ncbi:DUF6493 family protein [Nonomuraea gerenzanensis]|uniref:Secreted protein n=1 Tax=Nonomuraea gerenzanensis TaxID=93944 RepID=A0A1M4E7P9_9ACTN|nr:DUF6493 family protein [Nonomuraea gerenzanensis]UBU17161.1 DUF6493 family protein [Nonomuraea gerenzanensis]SBO94899.1 secreted protein [Nonomuraea gerenzanensis]
MTVEEPESEGGAVTAASSGAGDAAASGVAASGVAASGVAVSGVAVSGAVMPGVAVGGVSVGGVSVWESVVAVLDTGDLDLVADRILALDERARREVAAALPAHVPVAEERAAARWHEREARRERESEAAWRAYVRAEERAGRRVEEHERWQWDARRFRTGTTASDESWAAALRVAGAAAIGGAAAVVAWLNRRDLQDRWAWDRRTATVLERVLSARPAAWQAGFAARATLKLRTAPRRRGARDPMAGLVLAMLRRSGATPPQHDPLVVAWAAGTPIAAELREDPLLDHLLPRLFEAEGVGALLRDERADPPVPRSWLAALRKLQDEGRIGRDALLDGCLRRFLRGGQAADLRFFVRLHELLDPTYDEVSKRRRDYLRLLPVAPGAVAEPALRHLRRLEDLDPGEVTEAVLALLSRGERKLLTAGLTWLDEIARDPGAELGAPAAALGYAFACESADVQGRAVRLAVKHAKRFGEGGARAVREAATVLPQELRETLASVFGGEAGEDPRDPEGFVPVPLPAVVPAAAFPAPVVAAGDLEGLPDGGRWEAAELWLAGVVRLYGSDRRGLAARLAELWPGVAPPAGPWQAVWHWAWEIARLVTARQGGEEVSARLVMTGPGGERTSSRLVTVPMGGERAFARLPEPGDVPGPHLFLLRRWAEVCGAIGAGTLPPYLLAEPTSMTGHLDAGVLVERLAGYERAGIEALPADLRQALLRLPRATAPEVVARAGLLTSAAGRAAARWMGGDRPEPVAEIAWWYYPPAGTPGCGDRQVYREDREHAGTGAVLYELVAHLHLTPHHGDDLPGGPVEHRLKEHDGYLRWWPYLMPSDREAVAAHLVPHLTERWQRARAEPAQASALARADGPMGEAGALVLAYFAADRAWCADPEERARPLVELAARGELPAEEVGRQLALLVRRTDLKPGPVFETLESAATMGAHQEMWRIMTGFLAGFLPGPGERSHTRHAQGLTFALRAARWAGARGAVPCVAEIAQRRASNNFVREARRLHTYLT